MILSLEQLYDFAMESGEKTYRLNSMCYCLACQCALALTGKFHALNSYYEFLSGSEYTHVDPAFGEFCSHNPGVFSGFDLAVVIKEMIDGSSPVA